MVDTKKIIEKIQSGLKSCSEQHKIDAKDVQLMIVSSGGVQLWNADKNIGVIDIAKIFKLSFLENMVVLPYLKKALVSLSKKKNVNPDTAKARIFTKQADFSPCVYFQDGDKIIGEITIEELLKN